MCDSYYRLRDHKLSNVYDGENVYGYSVVKEGETVESLGEMLADIECLHIIENRRIFIRKIDLTEAMVEQFKDANVDFERRNLAEVYFE